MGRHLGWFLPSTMELHGSAMALLRHVSRELELDRTPQTMCGVNCEPNMIFLLFISFISFPEFQSLNNPFLSQNDSSCSLYHLFNSTKHPFVCVCS